jgi:predicted nuclease with RNAse H fold
MGISCFFTNKRSIVRDLIYRSISLNHKLLRRGYLVVEVYPYATKLVLFGDKIPPKNSARSVEFMREHLSRLIDAPAPHMSLLDRNTCDALLNAYAALLHSHMKTDVLGTPEEGLLVLPRLPH